MQFIKMKWKTLPAVILLAAMSFTAVFAFQAPALNRSLRLAPLANGWVSEKAVLHLSDDSCLEKYRRTVSHDLGVGRFRPASFIYSSLSYALSPLMHGRLTGSNEDRDFIDLVTGDLRLQSFIFLVVVSFSIFLFSLLIFLFSGSIFVTVIPICFISLSPALSGNLLQNYIDSQEIPLVAALSLWVFFFFCALKNASNCRGIIYLIFSILFLLLIYLTKETASVISVALTVCLSYMFLWDNRAESITCRKRELFFYVSMLFFSLLLTGYVYLKVVRGNTQYGTGFAVTNVDLIFNNLVLLWSSLSWSSVTNIVTIFLFLLALLLLIVKRKESINGIPVYLHTCLLLLLISLGCGYFFIQLPWKYSLVKYLFPSVFFFSFGVSVSIVLVSDLCCGRYRNIARILMVSGYLFYFLYSYNAVHRFTGWYYENATSGVSIVDELVVAIDQDAAAGERKKLNIFVEYGTDAEWGKTVPWGKLHLMRLLNIERGYNIIDSDGKTLLNIRMPQDELTSFIQHDHAKNIYLTNRREELSERKFDIVYKGYKSEKRPSEKLQFQHNENIFEYRKSDGHILYTNKFDLPEFIFQKYIPVF